MSTISKRVMIDAPKERVWQVLADFGGIYRWNPGVTHSRSTSEVNQGETATRHCDLNAKDYLKERVVEWQDGEALTIEVYETNLPLRSNVVRFTARSTDGGTVVAVTTNYRLKYGIIGAVMDALFARRQVQKGFGELLAGLKYHVETGETVEQAAELPESALAAVT